MKFMPSLEFRPKLGTKYASTTKNDTWTMTAKLPGIEFEQT